MNKKIIGIALCFISIFLNLFSLQLHSNSDFYLSPSGILPATITWFGSLVLFSISMLILTNQIVENGNNQKLNQLEKIILVILLSLALILRLYKINHQGLYLDEWYWLTEAKGILAGSITTPFGFIGDQPSNMPTYIVAFFLFLLKDSYLAVRLPGVLYSMLTIVLIFSFVKEAWNKKVALIAVLLLATSIWDIHMSQLGWNNVNLNPFLISGFIFFIYRGFKYYSLRDILISGIFLGVSINLLYIAALNIILAIAYPVYQIVIKKKRTTTISLILVLIVSAFLTMSPTIVKIQKYPMQSLGRHKNFIKENLNNSKSRNGISYYVSQIKLAVDDFKYSEENYRRELFLWGITLEPLVLLFFIVGLIYSLKNFLKPQFFIIIFSFIIMFIPVVILNRNVSLWREYGFVPTIYILASLGMYSVAKISAKLGSNPTINLISFLLISIIFIYLIYWLPVFNLYRSKQLIKENDSYETYCQKTAEYIDKNIPRDTLILLPDENCNSLISIVLREKYKYNKYASYEELQTFFENGNSMVAIVKMNETQTASNFSKENPIPIFQKYLRKYKPYLKIYYVRGENYKNYSVIFTFY